jgi:5-deoxy-glucuronate isomerase
MSTLMVKPSTGSGEVVCVTQERAGWQTISLRMIRLKKGGAHIISQPDEELALVMLGGQADIRAGGQHWQQLGQRANVFAGMPHTLYLPAGTAKVEITGSTETCEVAVCGARADRKFPAAVIDPSSVEVEIRGGGNATRQINHIIKPEFAAHRLLVVEVFTPAGNWSSYPPHKHDEDEPPGEVVLEEVYYYRTRVEPPGAFAVQRLYSPRHGTDVTETVRDGDIMLVPHGYHTTAAAHGYDLYYLNGLAGDRRSMASADDPSLAWIRPAWADLDPDPRVPLVTLEGGRR